MSPPHCWNARNTNSSSGCKPPPKTAWPNHPRSPPPSPSCSETRPATAAAPNSSLTADTASADQPSQTTKRVIHDMNALIDNHSRILPDDVDDATLVGRVLADDGPCVVVLRGGTVIDITDTFPTMSDLLESADPV